MKSLVNRRLYTVLSLSLTLSKLNNDTRSLLFSSRQSHAVLVEQNLIGDFIERLFVHSRVVFAVDSVADDDRRLEERLFTFGVFETQGDQVWVVFRAQTITRRRRGGGEGGRRRFRRRSCCSIFLVVVVLLLLLFAVATISIISSTNLIRRRVINKILALRDDVSFSILMFYYSVRDDVKNPGGRR